MGLYLGQISISSALSTRAQFVNFKPLYEYKDNKFYQLSNKDLQELLPESELRRINFYKYHSIVNEYTDKELVLFEFDTNELEDNFLYNSARNHVGYKINLENKDPVKHLGDFGYSYVVSPEYIYGDYEKDPTLTITSPNVYPGMTIMFPIDESHNFLLGPYRVSYSDDNELIIKLDHDRQTRIMSGWHFPYNYDTYYTSFTAEDATYTYLNLNEASAEKEYIDIADETILFKSFVNMINKDAFSADKTDLEQIETLLQENSVRLFVDRNIPEHIRTNRINKLVNIFDDKKSIETSFHLISKHIDDFLVKNKDSDNYQQIITDLVNNAEFMQKSQKFKIINEKIQQREDNLADLSTKCREMQNKLEYYTEKSKEAILKDKNGELAKINTQIDNAKENIKELSKELSQLSEGKSLNELLTKLKEDISLNEERNAQLEENTAKLSKTIDDIFDSKTERALNLTLDGMLSSKMIQNASKWENEQQDNLYKSFVEEEKRYNVSDKENRELVKYLVSKIKTQRPNYDDNFILNLLICVTQGFITFFSGEPGGGKTSICKILTKVLGLTSRSKLNNKIDRINSNRFINVSVERGWTNKRDFIGYYNPLTKEFDYSNRQIFDGLNILNIEKTQNQTILPFVILLDEANLSPMEYYWADFMNICDDLDDNSSINLGSNYSFKIPKTLRFLATINNDHTTEALSPRLIDRSWIIRLPKRNNISLSSSPLNDEDMELISWDSLTSTFAPTEDELLHLEMDETTKDIYKEILDCLNNAGINVSTRTEIAVHKYWVVAQRLFTKDQHETDPTIIALDYAIAQRILPHINGSGEEFGNALNNLKEACTKNYLRLSSTVLEDIINKGNSSMSYYQYFA